MRCIVFSNNVKKAIELEAYLSSVCLDVFLYRDIVSDVIDVVEDGATFSENAIKKVQALHFLDKDILLADDSGLEVVALGGKPGVFSARYGGSLLTDYERCQFLLDQMDSVVDRRAQLVCVIAIQWPNGLLETVKGVVKGRVATHLSGESGFGYDPIFIPDGYDHSFARLGPLIKQKISHRSQALGEIKNKINDFLAKNTTSS